MSTEESPLLASHSEVDRNAIYEKYTTYQKRIIVALVSWAGLVPCKFSTASVESKTNVAQVFVSSSFVPTIPEIAKDLNTSGATVRCALHQLCK